MMTIMMRFRKQSIKCGTFYMVFVLVGMVLLAMPTDVWGAEPEFPVDGFVEGWKTSGQIRQFTSSGLYGHINGGSELFLEFGFEVLKLRKYKGAENGDEIALEAYKMTGAREALGIYLMKCGNETPVPNVKGAVRCTGDRYQVMVLKGAYFISVNNFSGKAEYMPVMVELVNRFLEKVPMEKAEDLFVLLPETDRVAGTGVLFCGPFTLETIYTFGEGDVLLLGNKVFGVAARYSCKGALSKDGKPLFYHRLVVPYPAKERAREAFDHLKANLDSYITVISKTDNNLVFKDYQGKFGKVFLKEDKMEITVNLPQNK